MHQPHARAPRACASPSPIACVHHHTVHRVQPLARAPTRHTETRRARAHGRTTELKPSKTRTATGARPAVPPAAAATHDIVYMSYAYIYGRLHVYIIKSNNMLTITCALQQKEKERGTETETQTAITSTTQRCYKRKSSHLGHGRLKNYKSERLYRHTTYAHTKTGETHKQSNSMYCFTAVDHVACSEARAGSCGPEAARRHLGALACTSRAHFWRARVIPGRRRSEDHVCVCVCVDDQWPLGRSPRRRGGRKGGWESL